MKTLIVVSLTALTLSGCFTMHIENGAPVDPNSAGRSVNEWHHDIVFGLAEISQPINLGEKCESGWLEVKNEKSFIQGLIGALTWSMYTPWDAKYTCKKKSKTASGDVEIPIAFAALPKNV
jgi:hypothetical protein